MSLFLTQLCRHSLTLISLLTLFTVSIAASAQDTLQTSTNLADNSAAQQEITRMVTFKTNFGEIKLELNAEKAPLSTANFLSYVNDGHFDNTVFHRVIKGFMIQGGGFEIGMRQKSVKQPVINEANNGLENDKYTIAMARTNDPHSATAQFFINTADNASLNHSSETSRGWGYAVFGKVVEGFEVVDAIENSETSARAGHGDVPDVDVIVESASAD